MFTKFVRNAFLPAAAAFFCMQAQAATPVTQCGQKLNVPGETYEFTGNLNCAAAPIPTIFVMADGVKVDMKGFQYTGNGMATAFISSNMQACVAVKNVEISDGTIVSVGRSAVSVCVPGSQQAKTKWHIHDLTIRGTGGGVALLNAAGNEVNNVVMERLTLTNPNGGPVTWGVGIDLMNASSNNIHHNKITLANEEGIKIALKSDENDIRFNEITRTKVGVLAGAGVKENVIRGNRSLFNTVDMQDDNFSPACGTDDWIRNVFTVANQFCIH